MFENLKYTLSSTLSLFEKPEKPGKSVFSFSLFFMGLSIIFTLLLNAIFILIFVSFTGAKFSFSTFDVLTSNTSLMLYFSLFVQGVITINLGLFAIIFLHERPEILSIKNGFSKLSQSTIYKYITALILFTIFSVSMVFLREFLEPRPSNVLYNGAPAATPMQNWILSIFDLIVAYFPNFWVFFMLLSVFDIRFSSDTLKKYGKSFLLSIILFFLLASLLWKIIHSFNLYIMNFIRIPFAENQVPDILYAAFSLAIAAWFYRLYAGIMYFPIVYTKEKEEMIGAVESDTGKKISPGISE